MKSIKLSIYTLLLGLFAVSCADEPLPFETFDELQKGAFSRLLATDGGNFFFTDPDNSAFTFDVEYYGENNGADIASHEWQVRHRDNANGGVISDPVVLETKAASSFGTDPNSGLPNASFAFNMNDALSALGITIDDINGGDDLIFDGFVVLNNGARFGPDNTGNSVNGGAGFDGIFRFVKPLLCNSDLVGTYDVSTTVTSQGAGIGWDNCAGNAWTGQVKFETVGDGLYLLTSIDDAGVEWNDPSMGAFFACYGSTDQATLANDAPDFADGQLAVTDACNKLSWVGASQWGEVYSFSEILVNGADLTLTWTNDYGEGASSVISRTDGTEWPSLK